MAATQRHGFQEWGSPWVSWRQTTIMHFVNFWIILGSTISVLLLLCYSSYLFIYSNTLIISFHFGFFPSVFNIIFLLCALISVHSTDLYSGFSIIFSAQSRDKSVYWILISTIAFFSYMSYLLLFVFTSVLCDFLNFNFSFNEHANP